MQGLQLALWHWRRLHRCIGCLQDTEGMTCRHKTEHSLTHTPKKGTCRLLKKTEADQIQFCVEQC